MHYDIPFDKTIQNVVTHLQAHTSACVDTEKEKKWVFFTRQSELLLQTEFPMIDYCFALQSYPKCNYEYLRDFFVLPCKRKLQYITSSSDKDQTVSNKDDYLEIYRTEGTDLNLNKCRSGQRRTGRSEENFQIIQGAYTENPQISTRKSGLDVPKSTFNRIITLDLKWHPHKMHVQYKLLHNDIPRRLNFAQWFLQRNVRFVDDIVVGDESAFHLNGKEHLKSKVYSSPLRNTDELKQRMENEANLLQVDDALVRRVMAGMRRRMQLCIERNGGHTEGNKQ
ncbi:hypothetical protein FHG87_004643 [Trinorchestia longiramus]|nr:hypothetical protein FHG87_004643 [Trinorchestia longiramus]